MDERQLYHEAVKTHQASQLKFEYYFVGVTLAVLSFSIQTFSIKDSTCLFLIYIGWGLLLISFLTGFYRLDKIGLIFQSDVKLADIKKDLCIFIEALKKNESVVSETDGHQIPSQKLPENIEYLRECFNKQDKIVVSNQRKIQFVYKIQKWSFVLSLFFQVLFKVINK